MYLELLFFDYNFTIIFSFSTLWDSGHSLCLHNYIVDFFRLALNIYLYCKDILMEFPLVVLSVISSISVSYIIFYRGWRIIEKIIKSENMGTGVVGLLTGLVSALNLLILGDRLKKLSLYYYVNLNSLFNFIFYFICSILTRSIVYFKYFTRTPKDVTEAPIKNKYKCLYFLPFIFAKFNPNITPETSPLISYSFSMFILSLLVLTCFVNIIGYILSIYLISKYDVENKFPYFKRYIKFYSSTSKFFLILEVIIAFVFLLLIVILNFFLFTNILII